MWTLGASVSDVPHDLDKVALRADLTSERISEKTDMSVRSILLGAVAAAIAALAGSAGLAADAHGSCLPASQWEGWRSPSPKVIYLRVNGNDIYKLDLSEGSVWLRDPSMRLVNLVVGTEWICSPIDLQLALADNFSALRQPLIVRSITRLTPQQVKAIPPKYMP